MAFLKNYRQTFILIIAMIIGAIVGLLWGEGASVLSPFGDLFLNLLLVIIAPLIFLTISTSVAKIRGPKRLGKIIVAIVVVIIITSLIAAIYGVFVTYPFKLVDKTNYANITNSYDAVDETTSSTSLNYLSEFVSLITTTDFTGLLTKQNIVAIAVFAILFGIAIKLSKERGEAVLHVLDSFTNVVMSYIKIVFYYAPFGIGCYIAALVGSYGSAIAIGYLKTFVIYFVSAVVFYFVVYTLYAFISGGSRGVKKFWSNIVPVSLTALATCSSAACIPANITAAKNIGVSDDVAEPLIPIATTFHKDGSIIGSVFKVMFLVSLFGINAGFWTVIGVSLLAALFITAIPIGGGVISEMLILTMLGCPVSALQSLTIIATIIDAPATLLNVVGDTASCMLTARLIDGKDWMR